MRISWLSTAPSPRLPRSLAAAPEIFQLTLVAQRVHRLPEAGVAIYPELSVTGEVAQRLALEWGGVTGDVVQDLRGQQHESAVDPTALGLRLLAEAVDPAVAVDVEHPEAAGRLHCCDRRQRGVAPVRRGQRVEVDTRHAVAVGHVERLVADIVAGALQAAAGHRRIAGLDQRHPPRLGALAVHHGRVVAQVERHVGHMDVIVEKELLDYIALITETDHEVVQPIARIDLHNVPEDRPAADLDHRLRPQISLLGQAAAESPRENHNLTETHFFPLEPNPGQRLDPG